jgi:hypothetical protein
MVGVVGDGGAAGRLPESGRGPQAAVKVDPDSDAAGGCRARGF